MDKILLKPLEVAQILGIGRSLTYELIARKEIPSIRLGRCIRIPKLALDNWINTYLSCKPLANINTELSGRLGRQP